MPYNLYFAYKLSQPKTESKSGFIEDKITLPDPSKYNGISDYNLGWFHSYSGLKPDSTTPITSYTISEYGETFVLLNYVTVPMTAYTESDGKLVSKEYTVTFYRHPEYDTLVLGSDSTEADKLSYSGTRVNGFTLGTMEFNMKDGRTLNYDDFVASGEVTELESITAGYITRIEDTT